MLAHDVLKACDTKRERIPVCLLESGVGKVGGRENIFEGQDAWPSKSASKLKWRGSFLSKSVTVVSCHPMA